ncbi:MAG: hypothetical protein IPK72_24110 [Candidatus Eisenbacteria bacterium]|nr:hypothetical protein [Candidatus Eisenbacteria bacterium]
MTRRSESIGRGKAPSGCSVAPLRPWGRAVCRWLALLLVLCLDPPGASALDRLFRTYDERDGLSVSETSVLAQDSRGFIWIGTVGGLFRFDGTEIRSWAPRHLRHVVRRLCPGPEGALLVASKAEPLWLLRGERVDPVLGPDGAPLLAWTDVTYAADGSLWVLASDSLLVLGPDGHWRGWPTEALGVGAATRLFGSTGNGVLVGGSALLSRFDPEDGAEAVLPCGDVVATAEDAGGGIVALTRDGEVWRSVRDEAHRIYCGQGRGADLVVRGETVWALIGGEFVRIDSTGARLQIAPSPALDLGRALLVDREGSLWVAGFRGVTCLPEPETVARTSPDGLPAPPHAHHLFRTPSSIWVVTWFGTREICFGEIESVRDRGGHSGRVRADRFGHLWAADLDRGFIRYDGEVARRFPHDGVHGIYGSSPRNDGTLWLASDDGVFVTQRDDAPPRHCDAPPPDDWDHGWENSWIGAILEDSNGRLWFSCDEAVYECHADSFAAGLPVGWRRTPIPRSGIGSELLEVAPGTIWLATTEAGLFRLGQNAASPLSENDDLESLRIYGMVEARSGGIWLLGAGSILRVLPTPEGAEAYQILERLTGWQGLPTQQASDLHEDADGQLWLATLAGLVQIPAAARTQPLLPPPVELVDLRVDGEHRAPDTLLHLPWKRNRLELQFAALTFRDRGRLRYQARLNSQAPWQDSDGPTFRFVDLAPGRYEISVRATLDGDSWGEARSPLAFQVAHPWWTNPWIIALATAAAAALLYAAHRLRVAMLLRLERQRIRIAMDLHDEVGSGLGSIGILAGLISDPRVGEEQRRDLGSRIAGTAGDLGSALGEIVRTLRTSHESALTFATRLAATARRIVPEGRLRLAIGRSLPDRSIAPEVQRQLRLVTLEALHNALRHSGAEQIELGFDLQGAMWRLWVEDNGTGVPSQDGTKDDRGRSTSGGHGLGNIRERCRQIGAEAVWSHPASGGTRLEVRFRTERSPHIIMRGRSRGISKMISR